MQTTNFILVAANYRQLFISWYRSSTATFLVSQAPSLLLGYRYFSSTKRVGGLLNGSFYFLFSNKLKYSVFHNFYNIEPLLYNRCFSNSTFKFTDQVKNPLELKDGEYGILSEIKMPNYLKWTKSNLYRETLGLLGIKADVIDDKYLDLINFDNSNHNRKRLSYPEIEDRLIMEGISEKIHVNKLSEILKD